MKKLFLLGFLSFQIICAFSQSPQAFNYQMVVRDAGGIALVNQNVRVQISILLGPLPGTVVYSEEFDSATNDFGIISLAVGSSTNHTGDFTMIAWGSGDYYLKVEVDPSGASNYIDMGTTQLLSVPYAMFAGQSGMSLNDNDSDPTNEIQILSVTNDTLYLSNGGFVPLTGYVDTLWNRNGNKIYNTNTGNVGVGINDPFGKMVVQGDASMSDTLPLFEVKNRDGQTVFIVYPDSVRIYVGDDDTKTNKGVFAVSGRNSAKSLTNNYLWITPDSSRIFLDSLNSKGGFAVKSFGNALSKDFFSVYTDTDQVIDPSQKKILWYPAKSAFLSGKVLIEDPDSVGANSVAIGFESKAKGDWSQAMGYKCYARGDYSMAIGKNSEANANNSYAFGERVYARSFDSYALGSNAIAEGVGSYAFGSAGRDTLGNLLGTYTKATGVSSYSFGSGCIASGVNSLSFGVSDSATGRNSIAMGAYSKAYGDYSFAFGFPFTGGYPLSSFPTKANSYAVAIGTAVAADGFGSIAMGRFAFANGTNSISLGFGIPNTFLAPANYNTANGTNSIAVGFGNGATGDYSMAIGYDNIASGTHAVSFGNFLNAQSFSSFAIGRYNALLGGTAGSWVLTDPLFVVGNGTSSGLRSNALTILKNGNTGLGVTAPDATLDVVGTFQLGGGTNFSKYEAGTLLVGTNGVGGVKTVTLTFPTAFTVAPEIVVTTKNAAGINDVIVASVRNVTTTNAVILLYRVDSPGGQWGQSLSLDWFAWE